MIALFLVLGFLPGAQEMLEQVGHLAVSQHATGDSAKHQSEDRCAGSMHVCSCCRTTGATVTKDDVSLAPRDASLLVAAPVASRLLAGVRTVCFRPPIA